MIYDLPHAVKSSASGSFWRHNAMLSRGSLVLWRVLLIVVLVPALAASSAFGQAVTGTILGTVTDTTGAVIPGATVTLTHTATGRARTLTTDAAGEYTAPQMPTGQYTVEVELTGFKKVTTSNIDVGVDQRIQVNVK